MTRQGTKRKDEKRFEDALQELIDYYREEGEWVEHIISALSFAQAVLEEECG